MPKLLMQVLKERTSQEHVRIEKALNLFETVRALPDYILLLQRHLSFYRQVEEKIAEKPEWATMGLDFSQRQKVPLLVKDLRDLKASNIQQGNWMIPRLDTFEQAMGCAYVLEGSTLGSQYICRHFSKLWDLTPIHGLAFFNGYGNQTGMMWKEFSTAVNNYASDHQFSTEQEDSVVGAAIHTFTSVLNYLAPERV